MSKIIIGTELGSYSFDKAAKTITFTGFVPKHERILLITNVTNNTVIYRFEDATKGGTVSGQVLTLVYNTNTGSFNNSDNLQIHYWSELYQYTGEKVGMSVSSLTSLGSSATNGWQSDVIDLKNTGITDIMFFFSFRMPATAPSGAKTITILACPVYNNGSNNYTDAGTGTLPSGNRGTYTIANPNNLDVLASLSYTTTGQFINGVAMLSNLFPKTLPDGVSLILINESGAQLSATSTDLVIQYSPIKHLI